MNVRTFLDVDDAILTKALTLPETVRDRENLGESMHLDSKPFFIIHPKPGACVKTKTDSGEKVFLNICTADQIPSPEDISDAQLLELLAQEEPSFVIPMSIGNERLEADKGGTPCLTYDIAINTGYYEKCQRKTQFWLFTVSVIMDGVSNKFGKTLDTERYTVLKNKKAIGTLQQHRIENREVRRQAEIRKTLIEELPATVENPSGRKEKAKLQLDRTLLRQPSEGTAQRLIGLFEMPKGVTNKDIAVHVNPDRALVTIDKIDFVHDVWLPYSVNADTARSFLDLNLRILRLDLEVDNVGGTSKS